VHRTVSVWAISRRRACSLTSTSSFLRSSSISSNSLTGSMLANILGVGCVQPLACREIYARRTVTRRRRARRAPPRGRARPRRAAGARTRASRRLSSALLMHRTLCWAPLPARECANVQPLPSTAAEARAFYACASGPRVARARFRVEPLRGFKDQAAKVGLGAATLHSELRGRRGSISLHALAHPRTHESCSARCPTVGDVDVRQFFFPREQSSSIPHQHGPTTHNSKRAHAASGRKDDM
jgi:hypothetical protein